MSKQASDCEPSSPIADDVLTSEWSARSYRTVPVVLSPSATKEAVAHLREGLSLIPKMPASPRRFEAEIALQSNREFGLGPKCDLGGQLMARNSIPERGQGRRSSAVLQPNSSIALAHSVVSKSTSLAFSIAASVARPLSS
jgi:hypothetical protein